MASLVEMMSVYRVSTGAYNQAVIAYPQFFANRWLRRGGLGTEMICQLASDEKGPHQICGAGLLIH